LIIRVPTFLALRKTSCLLVFCSSNHLIITFIVHQHSTAMQSKTLKSNFISLYVCLQPAGTVLQKDQLPQRDCATHYVSGNLVNHFITSLQKYFANTNTARQHSSTFCKSHILFTVWTVLYTPCSKKGSHFYFLNSFVRHWPILIIFGMQHHEEIWCK